MATGEGKQPPGEWDPDELREHLRESETYETRLSEEVISEMVLGSSLDLHWSLYLLALVVVAGIAITVACWLIRRKRAWSTH